MNHLRMLIQRKIITTFVIIFLICNVVAIEIENCDTTLQLTFNDSEGTNVYKNFSKQSFVFNEKPVYYLLDGTKWNWNKTTIWWSKENNSWYLQTDPYSEEKNWTCLWKADEFVTKSKCLAYDKNCLGTRKGREKIDLNHTETHQVKATAQCIFPFKHYDTIYNSCTKNGEKGFWCATSVDANLDWQTFGFCNDLCPLEGIYFYCSFQN